MYVFLEFMAKKINVLFRRHCRIRWNAAVLIPFIAIIVEKGKN